MSIIYLIVLMFFDDNLGILVSIVVLEIRQEEMVIRRRKNGVGDCFGDCYIFLY